MKKYMWIGFPIVTLLIILKCVTTIDDTRDKFIKDFHTQYISYQSMYKPKCIEIKEEVNNVEEEIYEESYEDTYEYYVEQPQETYQEPISDSYTTRMTSFWANDGYGTGDCTGSGLCSWDFGINENGWYTYNGKLVIATATTYLANQGWYTAPGVHLYKYWEELVLTIDGVEYDAVILDSCGSSMKTDRIDLFVSNGNSARDTMIEVRRK